MSNSKNLPARAIAAFMADDAATNKWLDCRNILVYVRKSMYRQVRGDAVYYRPCLQVANWSAKGRWRSTPHRRYTSTQTRKLVEFMRELERTAVKHGYDGVYVENVRNHVLQDGLRRNSYEVIGGRNSDSPCYFKPTATIVKRSPWVRDLVRAAHERPHPSISAVAKDVVLDKFWAYSKTAGLKVYLKREVFSAHYVVPLHRVTILEIMRGRSVASEEWDYEIYADDDREILCNLLHEIEQQFHGTAEIAVSAMAMRRGSRPTLETYLSPCNATLDWLVDAGYEYAPRDPRCGNLIYVKPKQGQ